jgi:hypothetical protein
MRFGLFIDEDHHCVRSCFCSSFDELKIKIYESSLKDDSMMYIAIFGNNPLSFNWEHSSDIMVRWYISRDENTGYCVTKIEEFDTKHPVMTKYMKKFPNFNEILSEIKIDEEKVIVGSKSNS